MNNEFMILLVEDDDNDVMLIKRALEFGKILHQLNVLSDGVEVMDYLHQSSPFNDAPRPDMILLDLSLPKLDGLKVLELVKSDPDLRSIPIIALTNSRTDPDIAKAYDLHVNGFIVKPVDFQQFMETVRKTCNFWLSVVVLPSNKTF